MMSGLVNQGTGSVALMRLHTHTVDLYPICGIVSKPKNLLEVYREVTKNFYVHNNSSNIFLHYLPDVLSTPCDTLYKYLPIYRTSL